MFAVASDATQDVLEVAASHDLGLPLLQAILTTWRRVDVIGLV